MTKDWGELRLALQELVLELHQNEDERIRKGLIDLVSAITGGFQFEIHRITKKEAIAYLKKQKDAFENGRQFGIMQEQVRQELELPNEKQEEKQPISFNEPYNPDEYEVVIEGNAISLKRKEQKPVEWSEEDEKRIKHIKNHLEFLVKNHIGIPEYNTLEDKLILESEIRRLENRFKSLRPSWKPSEEQMRGLKFFLDFHRSQRNAGTTNWREYDAVESIYKHLKKL